MTKTCHKVEPEGAYVYNVKKEIVLLHLLISYWSKTTTATKKITIFELFKADSQPPVVASGIAL